MVDWQNALRQQKGSRLAQHLMNSAMYSAQNKANRDIQIIRHGATRLNNHDVSVDRIRGWTDVPLSTEGRQEAVKLGHHIARNPPDHIVSSDLHRAAETANIVSQISGVPVREITQGFRPWNVGDFSGQITKDAIPKLAKYAMETPDHPVPGGESFNDFRSRFLGALSNTLAKYPGKVAIVTHHRGERLLHAWKDKGFPTNGEIDKHIFTQKGEAPGHVSEMSISTDKKNGM